MKPGYEFHSLIILPNTCHIYMFFVRKFGMAFDCCDVGAAVRSILLVSRCHISCYPFYQAINIYETLMEVMLSCVQVYTVLLLYWCIYKGINSRGP